MKQIKQRTFKMIIMELRLMSKTVQQQHMKSLLPNKEKNNNIDARNTAC